MGSAAIDGLLQGAVDSGAVPGVVAVAGDRDGVRYEGAFGVREVGTSQAVELDTMIWIASMTKSMVSAAALQLIEEDQLSLGQPVADVLPEFGELQVLDGFDGEKPRLRPPARQPTIRELFTHTSGVGYFFVNANLMRYCVESGTPTPLEGKLAAIKAPLVNDPGLQFEYGMSTDWLGQVIEAVSGQDLGSRLRERLFDPLGMADTTFAPTEAQQERLMAPHSRQPDGSLAVSPFKAPEAPDFHSGGAGAYSTAGDYLRYMRALLRGGELDGERILQPETVDLMFTDHLGGLEMPELSPTTMPELSHPVPRLPVEQGFGLGLHVVLEDIPGMRRAGTGDWAGLANCFYWIDRSSGIAGTFLTSVLPFFDPQVLEAALGFEAAVYAEVGAAATAS
jgi:CubicO group peptidase (beta-lactamase class C family)